MDATWISVIQYIFPSVAVVLIAYWFINRPLRLEKMQRQAAESQQIAKLITPIRLSAYERLMLFLSRITPQQMVPRVLTAGMTVVELQLALLNAVRSEFEHNATQQLYVSTEAWSAIIEAKENMLQLINISATQVAREQQAILLAQTILTAYSSATSDTAIDNAENTLRKELQMLTKIEEK